MKAMIFAAGLGTRLQPLTKTIPKALITLDDKPMLQLVIEKLIASGADQIVVNMHHHPEAMRAFMSSLHYSGVRLILSDETGKLLDTGGGLKKAARWLHDDQAVILHNADVLCDINLRDMMESHLKDNALATLAVSRRKTSRYFLWEGKQMTGWTNTHTGETLSCSKRQPTASQKLAFSGIHIVSPDIFRYLPGEDCFSIINLYLNLAANHPVQCFEHDHTCWADIGTPEKLDRARLLYRTHKKKFDSFV